MDNILIIGSNGFLGKNLSIFFKNAVNNIFAISRENGDLSDPNTWEKIESNVKFDAIFYCVERTGNQIFFQNNSSFMLFKENFKILMNFENFLKKVKIPTKILFFNSLWSAKESCTIINENDLFSYSKNSKVSGLLLTKILLHQFFKQINSNKISHEAFMITTGTIFGPYDNSDHLIPSLLKKLINQPKKITLNGGGKSIRNYIYVYDLCFCILDLLNKKELRHKNLIISSEINMKIEEVVKTLTNKFGITSINWGTRVDSFSKRIPDISLYLKNYMPKDYHFKKIQDFSKEELIKWV